MAVRPSEEQIYRLPRSGHMEYTGNGIQNWFLKEMELFIYLSVDSSADASADAPAIINIRNQAQVLWILRFILDNFWDILMIFLKYILEIEE